MRINKKKKQQPNSQSIIQPQSQQRPFDNLHQAEQAADLQAMQEQAQQPGMNFGDISVFSADQSPSPIPIQAKLTIGQPNDKYEQEADQVASQVVQSINSPEANQPVQKTEESEEIQMKSLHLQADGATAEASAAPPEIEYGINQAKGGGQPLAPNLQQKMGSAMGADFSGVKVHTDNKADKLNQSIQAKAFTTGRDVFFKQGAYQPGNQEGQKLIAHELTHVVQQNSNAVQCQRDRVIQRYIVKRNGKAGKSIASVKEAINFLTKNNIDYTLAMVIALQAKRSRVEVSFADMIRDARSAKINAARSVSEAQEDTEHEDTTSVASINTDEAEQIIDQSQQHTNHSTAVEDDKEVNDDKEVESGDRSFILDLANYMLEQDLKWWTKQFAHFTKMMYHDNAAVLNMWNDHFKLGYEASQVLSKSSELIDDYAKEAAKLNQTTTICDLVAKFIMMSIVGGENYEQLQTEYEQNFNQSSSQSDQSSEDDFSESNSWTRAYTVGQQQVFESHMQQWLDQNTHGVMQVKFNGDHGPHTFVLERLGTGVFHMVQAYQGGLHLHEFMNNEVLESKTQPKKKQANEFGQSNSLTKSKLLNLMSHFVTALSTGKTKDGIPAEIYLQAFGAYYGEQPTSVDKIALLAFNVAESQDDVNYESQKGYLETM